MSQTNTPGQKLSGSATTSGVVDLFEVLATSRSVRRFRLDPVPEQDLAVMFWHATRAGSGTNSQPCRLIAVRGDGGRSVRKILGDAFRRGWARDAPRTSWAVSERADRMREAVRDFVENVDYAPLIVLFAADQAPTHTSSFIDGASVYPAVQNLVLTARGLGYGSTVTMWHLIAERELVAALDAPSSVRIFATVVVGRPKGGFGPVRRAPLRNLVYENSWGTSPEWAVDPVGTRFSGTGGILNNPWPPDEYPRGGT